jgi:hypothetical protein
VAHCCNSRYWEAEVEGSWFKSRLRKKLRRTCPEEQARYDDAYYNPSYADVGDVGPGHETLSEKSLKAQKVGVIAQVVELLPG